MNKPKALDKKVSTWHHDSDEQIDSEEYLLAEGDISGGSMQVKTTISNILLVI